MGLDGQHVKFKVADVKMVLVCGQFVLVVRIAINTVKLVILLIWPILPNGIEFN